MWEDRPGGFGSFVSWLDREGIPYLSHTKVSTVERCRLCFYQQFVLRERRQSAARTSGTLVHRAAQIAYERLRAGRAVDFTALAAKVAARHFDPSCRPHVGNAVATLSEHLWADHEILGVEEPFFLELAKDLPPVIGVVDLILRDGASFLVVDHKTGKKFNKEDVGQLVLYAEHVRRKYRARHCDGVFDQYRMVPNLTKVRKPVHQRTPVSIDSRQTAAVVSRYRRAWPVITSIRNAGDAWRGDDCWFCV